MSSYHTGLASLDPKKRRLESALVVGVNFHKILAKPSSNTFSLLFGLLCSSSNTIQIKKQSPNKP